MTVVAVKFCSWWSKPKDGQRIEPNSGPLVKGDVTPVMWVLEGVEFILTGL